MDDRVAAGRTRPVVAGWARGGGPFEPSAPGVATVDLAFPLVLAAAVGREIVAGRNWRNLILLAMLAAFALGNGLCHWEATLGAMPPGAMACDLVWRQGW